MMSMLTLAMIVLMVVTMRRPGARPKPPKPGEGDRVILGPGVKLKKRPDDPERPGVVSYALMKDKKLPSPTQRALRRVLRPVSSASTWVYRRFVPPKHDTPTAEASRRSVRQSAELQNFLDARNREIARRKSEGEKPGPDDRLH
jgi:hypothetical protein